MGDLECFFIVFGDSLNKDFSNTEVITTKVIPCVGDHIQLKDGLYKVTGRVINYKKVEDYDDLDDPARGGEMVYVFTEPANKF